MKIFILFIIALNVLFVGLVLGSNADSLDFTPIASGSEELCGSVDENCFNGSSQICFTGTLDSELQFFPATFVCYWKNN